MVVMVVKPEEYVVKPEEYLRRGDWSSLVLRSLVKCEWWRWRVVTMAAVEVRLRNQPPSTRPVRRALSMALGAAMRGRTTRLGTKKTCENARRGRGRRRGTPAARTEGGVRRAHADVGGRRQGADKE